MQQRNHKENWDGSIDCEVLHPEYGWIPYTLREDDVEEKGRTEWARAMEKYRKDIRPFEPPPPPSSEELEGILRFQRDELLKESDWSQLPDVPEPIRTSWASYRQALRDVPQQDDFPYLVEWPTPPKDVRGGR